MVFAVLLLANRDIFYFSEHCRTLELSDARFFVEYRLRKDPVRWLCEELRPAHQGYREQCTECASIGRFACCALGGCDYQETVAIGQNHSVEQSNLSPVITEVTDAILEHLLNWICFPQSDG